MRMRIGFVIGFAAGYYLGAMSGRERYEEINSFLGKARRNARLDTAADKAKAVVDLGLERARKVVDHRAATDGSVDVSAGVDDAGRDEN